MYDIAINYWAVLVAAIAAMVIGYLWYSMGVFGRMWMEGIGKTEEQIKAGYKPTSMLWTYLLAALMAYVLAHFISLVGADTISEALTVAWWAWLGFVAATFATNAIYEGRSGKLFWINSLYQLVNLLVMAAIIVSWR